ncbi:MAG: RidA family protein, partial [Candidatus Micrarchaeota archaeon]
MLMQSNRHGKDRAAFVGGGGGAGFKGDNLGSSPNRIVKVYSPICTLGAALCGTRNTAITTGILGKSGGMGTSTRDALAKALSLLTDAGYKPEDVVKAKVLLGDMGKFAEFNAAYADFFGTHKPARECVQTGNLSDNADLQLSLIASKKPIQVIFSKEAPEAIGPYSQAMMAGNSLYLSGQISGEGNAATQAMNVLKQLEAVLKEAGMNMGDVLKASVYLSDFSDFGAVNEAFTQVFPSNPPAREAVEMAVLPKSVKVEVSLIAKKGAGENKIIIMAKDAPAPVGPYSHAVEIGNKVFLSGQICREGDFGQQTETVLGNLEKVLRAAETTPQDVIAATLFLSDLNSLD